VTTVPGKCSPLSSPWENLCIYYITSEECLGIALIYILRYSSATRQAITAYNVHRLLITAVLVAAKNRDDFFYSNKYYACIGGIRLDELNALEFLFLSSLHFSVHVEASEFETLQRCLPQHDHDSLDAIAAWARHSSHQPVDTVAESSKKQPSSWIIEPHNVITNTPRTRTVETPQVAGYLRHEIFALTSSLTPSTESACKKLLWDIGVSDLFFSPTHLVSATKKERKEKKQKQ
jgi:hypothetical protein